MSRAQAHGDTERVVLDAVIKHPEMTASAIARGAGVSRERVRQLLIRLGLPTRKPRIPISQCRHCQAPLYTRRAQFCSRDCNTQSRLMVLTCNTCQQTFQRRKLVHLHNLNLGYHHIWCSKSCQGRWLGNIRAKQPRS